MQLRKSLRPSFTKMLPHDDDLQVMMKEIKQEKDSGNEEQPEEVSG